MIVVGVLLVINGLTIFWFNIPYLPVKMLLLSGRKPSGAGNPGVAGGFFRICKRYGCHGNP